MDRRIKNSRSQERRVAEDVGGRVTPGSGNQWHSKNDVIAPGWSIECKTTEKESFRLTAEALRLAHRNALVDQREMAFVVEIQGSSWVVLPYATFLSLLPEEE
jgi:hypothetical protein